MRLRKCMRANLVWRYIELVDVPVRLGFGQFAPMQPARGPMFSARTRAKLAGEPPPAVVQRTIFD